MRESQPHETHWGFAENKDGVAKAIMVEFGHDSEVFRIASALKNILRAFFQLFHQVIQPLIGSSGHASTLPFLWLLVSVRYLRLLPRLDPECDRRVALCTDQQFGHVKFFL